MTIGDIEQKIKDNKKILFILLSKTNCPVCGNFKDIVADIKSEHSEYLEVIEFNADDIEGLGIVPHSKYPMSYFYINNQSLPFIREGLVYGEFLNIEILKFKRVLDGEDPNMVFSG